MALLNRLHFTALLLFLFGMIAPGGAWAQGRDRDEGQYQILSARYGTAYRNVDVTQKLRELARSDRSFKIENGIFGDPHPDHVKTLRIFARARNGSTRVFEYAEGGYVDGARFSAWSGGGWGNNEGQGGWEGGPARPPEPPPGLRILQARYGTAYRNIDVTRRLQELASRDQTFKVENDLFGNDPDPNQYKILRIYARVPDGSVRMFEYREGGVVDGSIFEGWSRGGWDGGGWRGAWDAGAYESPRNSPRLLIERAVYGDGSQMRDVTGALRSRVRGGNLDMTVSNETLGTDPAPGRSKFLSLVYSVDGRGRREIRVEEGRRIAIP